MSNSRSKASPMDWNRNYVLSPKTIHKDYPMQSDSQMQILKPNITFYSESKSDTSSNLDLRPKDALISSELKPTEALIISETTTDKGKNFEALKKGHGAFSWFYDTCRNTLNARNVAIFPYIIIGYLRLLFHLTWFLCLIWSIWSLYSVIMNDITIKINNETNLILQEIERAKFLFSENKCFKEEVVKNSPALASLCSEWKETIGQKDPRSRIPHGRLTAETFAELLNSFVEEISFRSLVKKL